MSKNFIKEFEAMCDGIHDKLEQERTIEAKINLLRIMIDESTEIIQTESQRLKEIEEPIRKTINEQAQLINIYRVLLPALERDRQRGLKN